MKCCKRNIISIFFISALTFSFYPSCAGDFQVFDVIGDSVSAGANPDYFDIGETYGWVDMIGGRGGDPFPSTPTLTLRSLWPDIEIHNSAFSGATAADWATTGNGRLEAVLSHEPDLVAVMIGGNDFLGYIIDGEFSASEQDAFRADLNFIIGALRDGAPSPEIVVLTYYDLFDGYSANLPPAYTFLWGFSDAVIVGNDIIREVAGQQGCRVVDIYELFLHRCYERDLGDPAPLEPPYMRVPLSEFDIHPVTAGHERIYEEVMAMMSELAATPSGWMMH